MERGSFFGEPTARIAINARTRREDQRVRSSFRFACEAVLVAVVLGLIRAFHGYADVIRLSLR